MTKVIKSVKEHPYTPDAKVLAWFQTWCRRNKEKNHLTHYRVQKRV